jgi:guanine deaminase
VVTAVRGALAYFIDDPFLYDLESSFVYESDGLLVCRDGIIEAVGSFSKTKNKIPRGTKVVHYQDVVICPGFVDTHTHYVQTEIIGAYGNQLLDWLADSAFVAELKFQDKTYASSIAKIFCQELLRNGTTTAMVFCAVYPQSVDALFREAQKLNMRIIAGKVLMDRNAPTKLLDTAEKAYDDSKALIEKWHKKGRNLYAITPRFAPTSSSAQLKAASQLFREYKDVYVHSHISENKDEVAWVKKLFPKSKNYLDVYDHYNLIGRRSLFAHGVYLSETEMCRCHETETAISHCPTSNMFLGSGLFQIQKAKNPDRPLKVGLGTDIGAGTSFSLLATMGEAYKVAHLNSYSLDALKSFYLSTLGGAQALCLEDRIGTFKVGHEADFIVLDPNATPLMKARHKYTESIEDTLFLLMTLGDDRAVSATYVAGREMVFSGTAR